jgi:PKD repeat protein
MCILIYTQGYAQWHDRFWISGYDWYPETIDTTFGATYMDFSTEPFRLYYKPDHVQSFFETIGLISSEDGLLQFHSNGMQIFNGLYEVMPGGDTIAYGDFWTRWVLPSNGHLVGMPIIQGSIALPLPGHPQRYLLLYETADVEVLLPTPSHLFAAWIDMQDLHGQVLAKDHVVIHDTLTWGKIAACQHANGRDWWVVVPRRIGNGYYSILVDETASLPVAYQEVGEAPFSGFGIGQAGFSTDGTLYYRCEGSSTGETGGLMSVYDFDRCTGDLSNHRWWHNSVYSFPGSAISPNNRYIYSTDAFEVWQFDLLAQDIPASRVTIAAWDGYVEPGWFRTLFSLMCLAPDGRIYMIPPTGSSRVMHVIDRPNEYGEASRVLQHHIKLPTANRRTLPNYPNFRLGPLDGSACDTLGIDAIPVARFRHEPELPDLATIRFTDLSYFAPDSREWDFGDGTWADIVDPVHTYDATGTYTVCLTVRNQSGMDISCQDVFAEVASSTSQVFSVPPPVIVFPNPFSADLEITPVRQAVFDILILDVHGRTMLSVRMTCPSRISLHHLPDGMYFYRLEGNGAVYSGKLVKRSL